MKKSKKPIRLALHTETVAMLRPLLLSELRAVAGGSDPGCSSSSETQCQTSH